MCVVSNVGDFYRGTFPREFPNKPWEIPTWYPETVTEVTREEFEKLRKKVEEMVDLMKKAKEIDEKIGQPDSEMDEKLKLLREIAKAVGIDLDQTIKVKGA